MKKYLILILQFFCFTFVSVFQLNAIQIPNSLLSNLTHSPKLHKCIDAILKIPEAKLLIENIQKEGSIKIQSSSSSLSRKFGAFWDPDLRIIFIDTSSSRSEGFIISSILFELHNASVNSQINHFNELASQKKITKQKYVESMEYLEYINSLNASKISKKGIQMGVLPKDAYLGTYPSFKEHFNAQKLSGHSDCFSRNFEMCLSSQN